MVVRYFQDSDDDGLADNEEAVLGSNPNSKDSNSDGFDDGAVYSLGYNPMLNLLPFINYLKTNPVSGLYNQSQYDSNRVTGRNDVLNAPQTYNLYQTNDIMNLGLGGIMLSRNTNNQLVLNYQIMQSTDLTNWFPLQQNQLVIRDANENQKFLRVQALGQ